MYTFDTTNYEPITAHGIDGVRMEDTSRARGFAEGRPTLTQRAEYCGPVVLAPQRFKRAMAFLAMVLIAVVLAVTLVNTIHAKDIAPDGTPLVERVRVALDIPSDTPPSVHVEPATP